MKARPGPDETTSFTDTPLSLARKPRMANTTKPARMAVSVFAIDTINASLQVHMHKNYSLFHFISVCSLSFFHTCYWQKNNYSKPEDDTKHDGSTVTLLLLFGQCLI